MTKPSQKYATAEEAIAAWLATHTPTRCPTAYAVDMEADGLLSPADMAMHRRRHGASKWKKDMAAYGRRGARAFLRSLEKGGAR